MHNILNITKVKYLIQLSAISGFMTLLLPGMTRVSATGRVALPLAPLLLLLLHRYCSNHDDWQILLRFCNSLLWQSFLLRGCLGFDSVPRTGLVFRSSLVAWAINMFIVVANRLMMNRKRRKWKPREPDIHDEILIPTNAKLSFQVLHNIYSSVN